MLKQILTNVHPTTSHESLGGGKEVQLYLFLNLLTPSGFFTFHQV